MGSLGTGKRSSWRELSRWRRFNRSNLDALMTKALHHLSPTGAPLPVSPQNRVNSGQGESLGFQP